MPLKGVRIGGKFYFNMVKVKNVCLFKISNDIDKDRQDTYCKGNTSDWRIFQKNLVRPTLEIVEWLETHYCNKILKYTINIW